MKLTAGYVHANFMAVRSVVNAVIKGLYPTFPTRCGCTWE
jgi:hypothetical protein